MGVTAEGVLAIALVALVPLVALMLSAFVKFSVVLALLRNAIGTPDAPSALVVTGLSLIFTGFVMAPVAEQVVRSVESPNPTQATERDAVHNDDPAPAHGEHDGRASAEGQTRAERDRQDPPAIGADGGARGALEAFIRAVGGSAGEKAWTAGQRASLPVRDFLMRHARSDDRAAFLQLARELRGAEVRDDDLLVLAAAFVTSELTEAFAIGFLVFLPFVIIDVVVGLALGALGLAATPPSTISLPFKLLLFVAVDGWQLLLGGLVRGYLG